MKNSLSWKEIWEEFDDWYESHNKKKVCSKCKHIQFRNPDWEEQKLAIARIVRKRYERRSA